MLFDAIESGGRIRDKTRGNGSPQRCQALRNTARPGSSSLLVAVLKLGARREENTWSVTDSFKFPSFSIAISIYISARLRARHQVRVRRSRELQKDSSLWFRLGLTVYIRFTANTSGEWNVYTVWSAATQQTPGPRHTILKIKTTNLSFFQRNTIQLRLFELFGGSTVRIIGSLGKSRFIYVSIPCFR